MGRKLGPEGEALGDRNWCPCIKPRRVLAFQHEDTVGSQPSVACERTVPHLRPDPGLRRVAPAAEREDSRVSEPQLCSGPSRQPEQTEVCAPTNLVTVTPPEGQAP